MTFSDVTPAQLPIVWKWITDHRDLHMADEGPKTLKEFVEGIIADSVKLIAIHKGSKLIGAIGVKEMERHNEIRGMHFVEEARRQGNGSKALSAIVTASDPKPVRLQFLADNLDFLHFIGKFNGHFIPTNLKAHRRDVEIPYFAVELRVNPLVTLE